MKVKAAVWFRFCAVAINDCSCNDIGVVGVDTANSNSFAEKIYVSVSITGISADFDLYDIIVVGIVDCRLNIVKIGRAVVIDGYRARVTVKCCS